ncbi:succinate dehydrogenase assembly factor 3, mitochondrial [Metopolophium dirhodum]|uniref:succinate dehydrogenase assembly factor 3, mitochondrial n=1 Tax=Metopolophium dirhodum TaxID=44670 RepID=UPI00298FC35B|nr:succinate dehydrogenase assembly factor 3, mitochondrial [Metopolophium dirhodum]XP_060872157.1 succinate dehydrogenase assembly factor 3, mitochondrial [Metopolophium dirhodum]
MSGLNHVQRVRLLYKTILRLHRGLPNELQELGQAYVRDEFRRHKNCNPKETQIFMLEWSKYTLTLSEQLLKNAKSNIGFGKNIDKDDGVLDSFTDDQIVQLYNLFKETTGTVDKTIESELSK